MQLVEINENNKEQYQAFVQIKGVFLQDFEWGDFQRSLGRKIHRFALLDDYGEILIAAQFLESSANYLSAPHGPVLREPDEQVLHFFLKEIQRRFPNAVFFRIEPRTGVEAASGSELDLSGMQSKALKKTINLNPHKTLALDLTKTELELQAEMHPKTRYNIKIAQRDGVEIVMTDLLEIPGSNEDLLGPIKETNSRAKIRGFSPSYYHALVKNFSDPTRAIKTKVFTAWHENDLIATNIVMFYQDTCVYLFGGSANIKRNLMAPYLLQWQTIQKAKEEGYKKYDFWGVEDDPSHAWAGISRFKFGFGGEVKKYAGTFDYVAKPAWYNVYRSLRALNRFIR